MKGNKIVVTLFAVFVTLFSYRAQAQNCHFDKDEKDAFTGERTRMYMHFFYNEHIKWDIQLDQKGSINSLTITPLSSGRTFTIAPAGTKILVKLANATIIELHVDNDTPPIYTTAGTKWGLKSVITEDQLNKLAASAITDIQVKIGTRDLVCSDLKDKHGEKIMNAAKCMLQKD